MTDTQLIQNFKFCLVCIKPNTFQWGTRPSSSPESAVDNLEVSQTASTSGAPSLGLCTPVVYKTKTCASQNCLFFLHILNSIRRHTHWHWAQQQAPLMTLNTNHKFSTKNGIHTLSLALLRVPALATWGLLEVVSLGPTTTAQSVRLVPALTKRWCSLGLTRNRKQWN